MRAFPRGIADDFYRYFVIDERTLPKGVERGLAVLTD